MVSCSITILEVQQDNDIVGIAIDVRPDNSQGTEMERKIAGCFEVALGVVSDFIMSKGKSGEMIHGHDIEHLCNAMLKRHVKDYPL